MNPRTIPRVCLVLALAKPPLARSKDRESLVQGLRERTPAPRAARRSIDARRARVTAARTLPEPTVTFETMGKLLPPLLQRGDPSSARVLRFTQEIPAPGKLDLAGQIARTEADAEEWRYEELRRELVAELKLAYYDLWLARKTVEVLEKNRGLLGHFAEISEARYKVGQAAQADVLRAQVEVSQIAARAAVVRREEGTAEARINALLFRPPETPIDALPELVRPRF